MEKLIYEKPVVEIIACELEGVIASSGDSFGVGMDDLPDNPGSGSIGDSGW